MKIISVEFSKASDRVKEIAETSLLWVFESIFQVIYLFTWCLFEPESDYSSSCKL